MLKYSVNFYSVHLKIVVMRGCELSVFSATEVVKWMNNESQKKQWVNNE